MAHSESEHIIRQRSVETHPFCHREFSLLGSTSDTKMAVDFSVHNFLQSSAEAVSNFQNQ